MPSSITTLPDKNTGRFCIWENGSSLGPAGHLSRLLLPRLLAAGPTGSRIRPSSCLPSSLLAAPPGGTGDGGFALTARRGKRRKRGRSASRIEEGDYWSYSGRPFTSGCIIP